MDNRRKRNDDHSGDSPTYSRLFIVCEKRATEEELKDAFSKFGTIDDLRMPRDHNTGEMKGIAYIKFSKTSEAAAALEEMQSKVLPNSTKPIKVMIAANRADIQSDEYDEDNEKYKRLFINITKNDTETVLEEHFGTFGQVVSIVIQKDRDTGEPKGGAYIKYSKFSEAANAYENSEKKYRAIFALPKGHNKKRFETSFDANLSSIAGNANTRTSLLSMMNVNRRCKPYTQVMFMCSPFLTHMHVERFFDIIPGMEYCNYFIDYARNCGKGTVSYSNNVSAAYAVEKLDKFEYPPGTCMFVKPDNSSNFNSYRHTSSSVPYVIKKLNNAIGKASKSPSPDLVQLANAIAQASKLIKTATTGVYDNNIPDDDDLNYCSVKLPSRQPLADIDSTVAKRCFLVCKPQPPPSAVLRDIFCRFGDLINVYTLPNKTVGYARYASETAANEAIRVLHGAEICGVRIKVLEADEEIPAKRTKYDY